ncbi:pseudouridine synthase [Bifidobacterium callitrichidarum]|uniref:pseudouridine synthase n=1 Tax=Bifidobacterium callitrichidarum TaxID=2052941 RepID=UPI0026A66933
MRPHRYVIDEPEIPFDLEVLYEDERIIVVDKPHFLPTMPRGMWYRSTALMRLRERLGEPDITPAHRLDRLTAGVLVFVRDKSCRGAYQTLFQEKRAVKVYECLAPCRPITRPRYGTIERLESPRPFPLLRRSHITKVRGVMTAYEEPGVVNAETVIERGELVLPAESLSRRSGAYPYAGHVGAVPGDTSIPAAGMRREMQDGISVTAGMPRFGGLPPAGSPPRRHMTYSHADGMPGDASIPVAIESRSHCPSQKPAGIEVFRADEAASALTCRYTLHPRTGKTHQLRVHMNSLGLPIVGDDFYPSIETRPYDDFSQPLELVARTLRFTDPITGEPREFTSRIAL